MNIEQQCCSLEQAKRLYEFGVKALSNYYWVSFSTQSGQEYALCRAASSIEQWTRGLSWFIVGYISKQIQYKLDEDSLCPDGFVYSAYTVAELGTMLPNGCNVKTRNGALAQFNTFRNIQNDGFTVYADYKQLMGTVNGYDAYRTWRQITEPTEAQARAAMLIHLLENKLITPEQVNNYLTEKK